MKYCDVIIWPFHHKSFPEKNNTNRGIWQLKDINPPPFFWKRNFKIRHRSTPRYKMLFWYLIWVVQTHLYAKGFVVPMGGTIVYITFSNYNELCTQYHHLSIFFLNICRPPTKGVMFSASKYNVLTIYINSI